MFFIEYGIILFTKWPKSTSTMKYIFDLHKTMLEQHLILVYEGEFSQEVTKSILAMSERNMDSFGEVSTVKKKVFNIMVECLQNIQKHAESFDTETYGRNSAIFVIGKQQDQYIITSGNSVTNQSTPNLIEKIERVNSRTPEELKALYKEIIKSGKGLSAKGGAGLGFIDMARKSGNPIYYSLEPMDDPRLTFFSLKIIVDRKSQAAD